ncbi:MAG: GMC family oxidoreductase N-terminal domain-containing protein [Burkholderiaceae bacterium]|nr:GMC family oxidoreductase N-terminal domain-containing protein [Burkholderiaceae bacterium]
MAESAGKYDYIIVGAGTAGCVLANRLTQDKGVSVLLIEAGAKDDYVWVHIPLGFRQMIDNPRTDWRYRTQPEPGLNGRSLLYPSGKILGGSSCINSMIYQRGQSHDYDNWAELTGDMSWRWEQVLPLFRSTEDHEQGADSWHGVGGDWHIEKQKAHWKILDAFREAAAQTGIPKIDDFSRGEGCAYFYINQKNGLRLNTAKAFLRTITRRGNLEIMTGSQVRRLIIEETDQGKVCTGVEFVGGGKEWTADVSRETILTAGTFGSPQILQRSGIGPADLLQEHGIRVVQDIPGVGENVQDHMPLRMRYKISGAKSLNTSGRGYLGMAAMGLEYIFKKNGLASTVPSPLGAMVRSDPTQARPNLSYQVQPWSQAEVGPEMDAFPAITANVSNLRPTSRGQVRIQGGDLSVAPSLRMNYLSTDEDRNIAAAAIQLTRKIMAAPALQPYAPQEIKGTSQQEADLHQLASQLAIAGSNPVGSCKMGAADDSRAVVDSDLKVRGVAGLRVADASIMPVIIAGDTGATTIMIAEKAAQLVRASVKTGT